LLKMIGLKAVFAIFVTLLGIATIYGKRGASGRVPLGKFRIGGVKKSKQSKPLSGDQLIQQRFELIEQQKAHVKQRAIATEAKLALNRAKKQAVKVTKADLFEKRKVDLSGSREERVRLKGEETSPPKQEKRKPSSLSRLLVVKEINRE